MQEAAKCKTSGNEATAADPVSCIQAEAHGSKTPTKTRRARTDFRAPDSAPLLLLQTSNRLPGPLLSLEISP